MARLDIRGVVRDQNGVIIPSATVVVYEAGTTTLATMYEAVTGGDAVETITVGSDGSFLLYIERTDYTDELFKIVISKANYATQTQDDLDLLLWAVA